MKTFDEMFKDLQSTDKYFIWIDGDEVRMAVNTSKCGVCRTSTRFYSVSFTAFYCSIKCLDQEWENYYKAIRRKLTDDTEMPMQPYLPGPSTWSRE